MKRQIEAASNEGDIVWEPFGGLASASVAAILLGRKAYAAEQDGLFYELATDRLEKTVNELHQTSNNKGEGKTA